MAADGREYAFKQFVAKLPIDVALARAGHDGTGRGKLKTATSRLE
jgi:hypothetical protein